MIIKSNHDLEMPQPTLITCPQHVYVSCGYRIKKKAEVETFSEDCKIIPLFVLSLLTSLHTARAVCCQLTSGAICKGASVESGK